MDCCFYNTLLFLFENSQGFIKRIKGGHYTKACYTVHLYASLYHTFRVFLLTFLPFWKWLYVKDIAIWVLFAGVPVCNKAIGKEIDEHYFRDIFFYNIKFAVLVEFIISTFTFSLISELLILPAITFLALLDAIAGAKPEYSLVKKSTTFLLIFAGLSVLAFSLKEAVDSYQTLGTIDLLVSFCVPIVFSALYIPFAYGFAIYAKYEVLFIRMGFKEPKDKKVKRSHRIAVLSVCKLSYKKIIEFEREYVKNMYVSMEQIEFDNLIKEFKANNSN